MHRPARIHQSLLWSLAMTCMAASWWGCAKGSGETTTGTLSLSTSSGSGGSGGTGGGGITLDGGAGGGGGDPNCTSTSAAAHRVPLDILFLIDQSDSMKPSWGGVTSALTTFFNDPASAAIGTGLILFPFSTSDCDVTHYEIPVVPIAPLPGNAFSMSNALPAVPNIFGTPMFGALKGTLMVATAYQDANPDHKVNVVIATDGDPKDFGCNGATVDDVANLAKSALDYNGVHTYVIGIPGSDIATMNQIASAGGTTAAYDVTQDISEFSAKIAEIRSQALGCDFDLPAPPHGKKLNPNQVNVDYTPNGMGMPIVLPRAQNHADCHGKPGWYFDNNAMPTKVELCPSSCTTVQNDDNAKVDVLFGCTSVQN
jgi:von Willebrand factor type A domain